MIVRTDRVALLVAACALSCAGPAEETTDRTIELTECFPKGLGGPALCGTHEVFEDRAAGSGRRIALNIVVVPARATRPEPDPVFILAGGPGQAAVAVGPMVISALSDVRTKRDFVLVDQRGTGESNPLECDDEEEKSLAEYFQ